MITGDNPLTAVHVAREVEIVDRDVYVLDASNGPNSLVWRSAEDDKEISVDVSKPLDV